MPSTYELACLLKVMPKIETASTLKRAATAIFQHGGIIRKIENLGTRPTPYKISAHGSVFKEASYFILKFDFPPSKVQTLIGDLDRDVDIIRERVYRVIPEEPVECTLEEEIKPAPYRKEVQEMIESGRERAAKRIRFQIGNNVTIDPFQR